ncbi:hybrid sensor histidine kinase/response regulator [Desulfonatronovibrio magnus]|uniref:hybrid sensor histidine kinase/response regulator n=1 Tax=Desulfonatronovibrio magnus TaxID=698827 RepID=UPI0006968EF8|nr:response regulator [Desulfonatronovibrio magnus]
MSQDQQPATVMIVDDTPANLNLLKEMLESAGYRVVAFPSGPMALKAAVRKPPDIILLDIKMPQMNGFEVCQSLKNQENTRNIPVIFISALNETQDKVRAFSVGGVDYITKPFQSEEIFARVDTHLKIRSLQKKLVNQNRNLEKIVQNRTRELVAAHEKLLEQDKIKNDFLHMISHEIRTPANGVLGMAEIAFALCPDSEEKSEYEILFRKSSQRLVDLIDDATLIADMENLDLGSSTGNDMQTILDHVRLELPEIDIQLSSGTKLRDILLAGDHTLLQRSLSTILLMGAKFSRNNQQVRVNIQQNQDMITITIDMDNFSLSQHEAEEFFNFESPVRSSSALQELGLAPVVVSRFISALGGELELIWQGDFSGQLKACFSSAAG